MVLPSYSFIFIFLPIVIVGYYALNKFGKYSLGKGLLLLASLLFYYLLGWKAFVALLLSIVICYFLARFGLREELSAPVRKIILILGIVINIATLIYCKYLTYFELLINDFSGSNLTFTALVVPTGISYYTFSQIAFLVDSYREPTLRYPFIDYALFVTFFPKITVGPIALSTEMIGQFNDINLKRADYSNLSRGFYRFTLGMAKKLLIADNLGPFVDLCYLNINSLGSTNAFLAVVAYTFQIYFDFSGYCDIAIGICQMLNMELVDNFNAPYRSLSIAEFWKRWHITLTRFFRNYLYIPMGGNRKGVVRTYINNMLIFLISGLWHGAATHFVAWGAVHGVGSIVSKIASPVTKKLPGFVRWLLTFAFVSLAWVLFRAPDMNIAGQIYTQLFTGGIVPINVDIVAACIPVEGQLLQWIVLKTMPTMTSYTGCAIIVVLIAIAFWLGTFAKTAAERTLAFKATRTKILTTVILFTWSVLSLSQVTEFIYVNF